VRRGAWEKKKLRQRKIKPSRIKEGSHPRRERLWEGEGMKKWTSLVVGGNVSTTEGEGGNTDGGEKTGGPRIFSRKRNQPPNCS